MGGDILGGARLLNNLAIGPKRLVALPNVVDRPEDVPSRGQAWYHGSARFQSYRHCLTELIGSSD
jgi:hypothetical protein